MGLFDTIKRKIQRIIPGGKTGNEGQTSSAPVNVPGDSNFARTINQPTSFEEKTNTGRSQPAPADTRQSSRSDTNGDGKVSGAEGLEGEDLARFNIEHPIQAIKSQLTDDLGGVVSDLATVAGGAAVKGAGFVLKGARALLTRGGGSAAKVAAEATRLGVDEAVLAKAVNAAAFRKAVADLATLQTKKTFTGLTKKQLTLAIGGVVTVGGGISGAATLTTWLASDNLAGLASMTISNIEGKFRNNEITREDALEQMNQQVDIVELAQKTINKSTWMSPFLAPFRNVYMKNVENILEVAGTKIEFVSSLEETQGDMFARLKEEADEAQEERDKMFARRREKEADEDEAEFRERTLLIEAIRKRNAGTELTAEELALLIKFGLDTKVVKQEEFGRSALNFGGLF